MAARLAGMPKNVTTTRDFAGRRVVDREGIEYGRVRRVHIDEESLGVAGMTVGYGMLKRYYLPRSSVSRITDESVLLTTPPIRAGVRVDDVDGHKIGKVRRINRNTETGDVESIQVAHGLLSTKTVSLASIWGVGKSVTLKMTRSEFRSRP